MDSRYQKIMNNSAWEGDCLICVLTPSNPYPQLAGYGWVHRYIWEHHNGPIPEGMLVCHTCDIGHCINIAHLFLGTHADNSQDMVNKGRHRSTKGYRKLELEHWGTIVSMRYNGESYRAIGRHLKVKGDTIKRFLEDCPHD